MRGEGKLDLCQLSFRAQQRISTCAPRSFAVMCTRFTSTVILSAAKNPHLRSTILCCHVHSVHSVLHTCNLCVTPLGLLLWYDQGVPVWQGSRLDKSGTIRYSEKNTRQYLVASQPANTTARWAWTEIEHSPFVRMRGRSGPLL